MRLNYSSSTNSFKTLFHSEIKQVTTVFMSELYFDLFKTLIKSRVLLEDIVWNYFCLSKNNHISKAVKIFLLVMFCNGKMIVISS